MNNEYIQQVLQEAMEWVEAHPGRDDDNFRIHMTRLMSLVNTLRLELQQKNEKRLWEL
jgi:hypothetical protein